jgi:hypothetical protein
LSVVVDYRRVLDALLAQLRRALRGGLARRERRQIDPPPGRLLGATLSDLQSGRDAAHRLLGARGVAGRDRPELDAGRLPAGPGHAREFLRRDQFHALGVQLLRERVGAARRKVLVVVTPREERDVREHEDQEERPHAALRLTSPA